SERRKTDMAPFPAESDPFRALQRRMDRLLDDFAGDYQWPFPNGHSNTMPTIDVSETDKELTIEAELPGVDTADIGLTLMDNVLTIRGEKKEEKKNKDYHLTERTYGSFSRSMTLPFDADSTKVKAAFKDGVLTITLPKPPEVEASVKKIDIKG
ncbi:MAG: Hsp20/alpha crystallin family protein, partial [Pseudomonadota bacterium]